MVRLTDNFIAGKNIPKYDWREGDDSKRYNRFEGGMANAEEKETRDANQGVLTALDEIIWI